MTSSTITAPAPESRGVDAPRILALRTVHEGWGRFLITRLRLGDGSEIGTPTARAAETVLAGFFSA